MAIIIEEEKKSGSWIGIAGTVIVVVIVFIGGYYLFFKQPELIEVVVPDQLNVLTQLSGAKIDPQAVVGSPTFKSLRDYSQPLETPPKGRANPFKPF